MTSLRRLSFMLPFLPLALLLQGCGPGGHVASAATEAPPPPVPVTATGWTGREDIGHAIELLREAGCDDDTIAALRRGGVLGSAREAAE